MTVLSHSTDIWALEEGTTHLNHGGFGAVPRPVLEEQGKWRDRMESNPTRFLTTELQGELEKARAELGAFVTADPDGIILIHNTTTGVNNVMAHVELKPGDRVVTTNHDYNACRGALQLAADKAGAELAVVDIPFPINSPDVVVTSLLDAVDERTRLVMIDHVTSPTGLVFPIDRIVPELEAKGIPVLVDGAHAPGMVPVDIAALDPSYYVGNCHKWMCAPKGSAFLWVAPRHREEFVPLVVSHGWNMGAGPRFRHLADWMGTDDPTAWLAIPEAIETMAGLHPDGWDGVRRANRGLALAARDLLTTSLEIEAPAPDEMVGALVTVPLPDDPGNQPTLAPTNPPPLMARLLEDHGIIAPTPYWPSWPHRILRVSAQRYNQLGDFERLAEILPSLLEE